MKVPCGLKQEAIEKTWKDIEVAIEALKNPLFHAQVLIQVKQWLDGNPSYAALEKVNPELYKSMVEGVMWVEALKGLQVPGYY